MAPHSIKVEEGGETYFIDGERKLRITDIIKEIKNFFDYKTEEFGKQFPTEREGRGAIAMLRTHILQCLSTPQRTEVQDIAP
jgi:hypothetical protein